MEKGVHYDFGLGLYTCKARRTLNGEAVGVRLTRSVVASSASQAVVIALALATSIAQARLLGAAGRGELALFVSAGGLIVLYFGLGINSAITYFVASGAAHPRALLRTIGPLFVATAFAVPLAVAVAGSTDLARFLPAGSTTAWLVASLTAYFALTQAGSWVAALLAARGDFKAINASSLVVALVVFASSAGLLAVMPTAGAWVIIGITVAVEGLRVTILSASLVLGSGLATPSLIAELPRPKVTFTELWRYSMLSYLGDALQFLTYRFDVWVVEAFRGTAELGRYALAVSLAQLVWIIPTATARVLFPYAATLTRAEGARLARRAAVAALVISGVMALAGWIGTQFFLTALFGNEFGDVPQLLGIVLLGVVPYSLAKVLANYLAGVNAVGVNAAASAAILILIIALDLLLIPRYGAFGAAWATAVSYSIHTVLIIAIFWRRARSPAENVPVS